METTSAIEETCRCCGGSGVQTDKDGLKVRCPCCGGTGQWNKITW